ncbi:MAG: tetratricopeptide repeat protein [Rikenellaceae bacterium]|nr:tetratricopeptide repeat protein [Rikenellaceae bacterium]
MRKIVMSVCALLLVVTTFAQVPTQWQQTLKRGRELYEAGRWSDARHTFRAAQSEVPSREVVAREEIDYYLAATAVELGSEEADKTLLEFMRRHPNSTFLNEVRFALGSYYCAENNMPLARRYFAECAYNALSAQQKERYDVRMGYVAFAERNYREAYDYFSRINARSEFSDHATYYKAYIDYAEGRNSRAKEQFQRLITSSTYGELAPYYLLQIEFREGNYRYVVEHGEALAQKAVPERRAELERVIAESWFHLDDYRKTLQHIEAYAATGGAMDRDAAYLRGFSLYRLARYAEAEPWLREACGPKDALTQNASYHLADCFLRLGKKEQAQQAFAMAADTSLDPTIAEDALFNCAKLQYELGGGLFNGAINLLSRYIRSYPRSQRIDEARTLLIAAYYNSRDYDAAYRAIKSLSTTDSELRTVLQKIAYFRALEAYKAGDISAAHSALAESSTINVSPRYSALSRFWQGEIAYEEGDYTTSATKFEGYLKIAPKSEREYSLAWYNLGYCHFQRERMSDAEHAFNQFLTLYPTRDSYRGDALNRLGDVAYSERRFDEAVSAYERSVAQGGPTQHYAAYKRAISLGILGRSNEKIQALQQILRSGSGSYLEEASYELGRTYLAREQYAEGAAQLERFVKQFPQSAHRAEAYSALGLSYLNMGRKEQSLAAYHEVVNAAPQSPEAREAMQGIRDIYVSEGNVDGYFAYAERVGVESDLSAIARDSLSFAAAQKLYLDEDRRSDAERSLRSYLKSYPKGAYRVDALYYLSTCYLQDENTEGAIETLTELTAQGTNQYTVESLKQLAELTAKENRHREAAAAYRKLYDVLTKSAEREAAMVNYVRQTLSTEDQELIAAMAADVVGCDDAGTVATREAKFAWAEQMRKEGRTAAAHRLYSDLASEVKSREGSAAAYYVIEYNYAEGAGDPDKTESAIFAYAERNPKAYFLAKAYLLLGDVYVKKGDLFQARATYQSVADGYSPADDGIVAEAKARIEKLSE